VGSVIYYFLVPAAAPHRSPARLLPLAIAAPHDQLRDVWVVQAPSAKLPAPQASRGLQKKNTMELDLDLDLELELELDMDLDLDLVLELDTFFGHFLWALSLDTFFCTLS
jgi:hypothetical protein